MGDGAKSPGGQWTTERISMSHLGSFSRSSTYVRSLVRQQFQNQSDQPNTAWERLRERLSKKTSFEYEEETPSAVKKRKSDNTGKENSDDNEEEGDEEEIENSSHKISDKQSAKTPYLSHGHASASSGRRLSAPQTSGNGSATERRYTLPSTDAHSKILNRRLSLAESVIKNYSKYIRTPDEARGEQTASAKTEKEILVESKREQANKQPIEAISEEEPTSCFDIPPIVAISEGEHISQSNTQHIVAVSDSESSPLRDTKLVNCDNPPLTLPGNFLVIPGVSLLGSSYTVPPSPVTKPQRGFFDASVRRKSFSGMIPEEFLLARSVTDVTLVSTKDKVASNEGKLPRLSGSTQTSRTKRKKPSPKSREDAIQELRGDYEKLAKKERLNRIGRKNETVYQQLQRDRERRAREAQKFYLEMDQITKSLKAINSRLDDRIKILNCNEPHKVRYQRILQVAFASLPFKKL